MSSQKSSSILVFLMIASITIIGIMITGFFAFSPLSYVQLNISIKTWCMFINGFLWMILGWIVHWIEVEGLRKVRISDLEEFCSAIGRIAKFFYLPIILLKVIMALVGASILTVSILELRSLGAGKIQMGAVIAVLILVAAISLFLIFQESSSARK